MGRKSGVRSNPERPRPGISPNAVSPTANLGTGHASSCVRNSRRLQPAVSVYRKCVRPTLRASAGLSSGGCTATDDLRGLPRVPLRGGAPAASMKPAPAARSLSAPATGDASAPRMYSTTPNCARSGSTVGSRRICYAPCVRSPCVARCGNNSTRTAAVQYFTALHTSPRLKHSDPMSRLAPGQSGTSWTTFCRISMARRQSPWQQRSVSTPQ